MSNSEMPSTDTVMTITGVAVDDKLLKMAISIIEIHCSTSLEKGLARFSAKDRTWLSKAICYQAAWMDAQPDMFSRVDVSNLSQDGQSFTTRDSEALTIAPLARRALSRLSWKRTRTVRVRGSRLARQYSYLESDAYGAGVGALPAHSAIYDFEEL
jgi:hypothetical protein